MDKRITDANKFVEGYGFRKEDLIGQNYLDFVAEKYKEKAIEDFEKLRRGIPQEGEFEIITPKGNVTAYYRDNPIIRAGHVIGVQAVLMDITERKRAEEELRKYQGKLKAMASEILQTQERERQRLAIGLHDDVCQKLVFTKLTLESLRRSVSDAKLGASLKTAVETIGETIHQAESLTFELGNPVLREFGFVAALEKYLAMEIRRKHKIAFELGADKNLGPLQDDIKACLFRVTRELLTNVVKHAAARKVWVSVHKSQGKIHVTVRDDGVGFKPAEVNRRAAGAVHFGLFSVREQLEHLGGRLVIESEPDRGTTATVIV
ncbi:MAG: hypothetical protein A2Z25_19035 [Planctomycetes bacterium RBG_16_55_9]|nr:MAG: hypothetical protein A2Z25_19035 [Planctomycetes bacterium RBG_16_55_9]